MKKFIRYPAIFRWDEDGKVFVEFPDLEGCYTQGNTIEAAYSNAMEALTIYYIESHEKLPIPSLLSNIERTRGNVLVRNVTISMNTIENIIEAMSMMRAPYKYTGTSEKKIS